MGQQESWKMTPLDSMLCSNQLQILKSLVFFFPPARQRQMIFLVKLMELRQCLTLPLSRLSPFSDKSGRSEPGQEIFEQIFPYCDHERQQFFRQMQNAFQMMKTVQQYSDSGMFDNLSGMMGDSGYNGDGGSGSGGTNVFGDMSAFANMGNPGGMMNFFSQMAGMNSAPSHATGGDQLSSMLSSMMNPEQQARFAEYEAMLDDL